MVPPGMPAVPGLPGSNLNASLRISGIFWYASFYPWSNTRDDDSNWSLKWI